MVPRFALQVLKSFPSPLFMTLMFGDSLENDVYDNYLLYRLKTNLRQFVYGIIISKRFTFFFHFSILVSSTYDLIDTSWR
jgi:hypothetical protein